MNSLKGLRSDSSFPVQLYTVVYTRVGPIGPCLSSTSTPIPCLSSTSTPFLHICDKLIRLSVCLCPVDYRVPAWYALYRPQNSPESTSEPQNYTLMKRQQSLYQGCQFVETRKWSLASCGKKTFLSLPLKFTRRISLPSCAHYNIMVLWRCH